MSAGLATFVILMFYSVITAIVLFYRGEFGEIKPPKDRERLLAEKAAWEEIWGIEERAGLSVVREPLPTRPNPTSATRRGTGSGGPHFAVTDLGTTDSGPR